MCSDEDIKASVAEAGVPERINIVSPRACAYVTMPDRRSAFKIMDRLGKDIIIGKKNIKVCYFFELSRKINLVELGYWTGIKERRKAT